MSMKILCIVGTRPEAIKMAPVIAALRELGVVARIIGTGQHREMLHQTLAEFGLRTDVDLEVMRPNQSLSELSGRLFPALAETFSREKADMVLAQGDTTTVFVASVVAFYSDVPFGHVEAGLRTGSLRYPFPEEFNRVVTSRVSTLHFAPTDSAKRNLLSEGVAEASIFVTGNTVIDALLQIAAGLPDVEKTSRRRKILLTAHRRENFGAPMEQVFEAIVALTDLRPDLEIIYPVHPNPNVREPAERLLGTRSQVRLSGPLGYRDLVAAMKSCDIVLTDSGGIQEEAPALGKPVLVLREETERPEAVHAGVAHLVGTDRDRVVEHVLRLLDDDEAYRAMAIGSSPYGDGAAAPRISRAVVDYLCALK
jgi:UDP-N-acetylglucosamine 2-epimerase (non-hydrolysing)